jgi:hypothetical protein
MRTPHFVAIASIALVCGCGQRLALAPPKSGPLRVTEFPGGIAHDVPYEGACYKRVVAWLGENGAGWQQYYATPPAKGVEVTLAQASVQFVDGVAIAKTEAGVVEKDAPVEMYSCLTAVVPSGT